MSSAILIVIWWSPHLWCHSLQWQKAGKSMCFDLILKSTQEMLNFLRRLNFSGGGDWHFLKTEVYLFDSSNTTIFWIPLGQVGRKIMANQDIHQFYPFTLVDDPMFKQLLMASPSKRSSQSLLLNEINAFVILGAHSIFMTIWGYPKRQHREVFGPGMIDSVCKYLLCQGFSLSIDGKWCIIN